MDCLSSVYIGKMSHIRDCKVIVLLFNFAKDDYETGHSFNAQEERMATSPYLVIILHLSHAIVMRLHVRKSHVVILTR